MNCASEPIAVRPGFKGIKNMTEKKVEYSSRILMDSTSVHEQTKWLTEYYSANYKRHLPAEENIEILEIGSGMGLFLKWLTDEGYANVTGVDISMQQCRDARKLKLENIKCQDILEYLRGNSRRYDLIVCIDVLEHLKLDYLYELISRTYDALNPGGRLIVQSPNAIAPFNAIRYADITHRRTFTVTSIRQLLAFSGFKFRSFCCYEIPPHIHGLKSWIRNTLWLLCIRPLIFLLFSILWGDDKGKIYTPNFLVVVDKEVIS